MFQNIHRPYQCFHVAVAASYFRLAVGRKSVQNNDMLALSMAVHMQLLKEKIYAFKDSGAALYAARVF